MNHAVVGIWVAWLSLSTGPVRALPSGRRPQIERPSEATTSQLKEVRTAAERALSAITAGDWRQLLTLMGSKGVAFGIDTEPINRKELRREMIARTGAYCAFFDTECLRRQIPGGEIRTYVHCYRDLLRLATSRSIEVSPVEGAPDSVEVNIVLHQGPGEPVFTDLTIDFEFLLEHEKWWLIRVDNSWAGR